MWQTQAADMQLVCSPEPLEYSVAELRERMGTDVARTALAQAWKVDDVEGVLGHFVANTQWADAVARIEMLERNTDDRTVLEYSFAKTVGGDTGFSVEKLRENLGRVGYERPLVRGEQPDWTLVELRRQEFNLLSHGQLSLPLLPDEEDRTLVECWYKYRMLDFPAVVAEWPAKYHEPNGAIQRLVLARSYAELGRTECLELLTPIEAKHPIDVAAVRVIYFWRIHNVAEAANALERFYKLLAESPWTIGVISDSAFSRSADVARADKAAAERLYPLLTQTFAARRFEFLRLQARIMVAETLGPEKVVESLAEMEPNIPWLAEVLAPRAKAYAAVNHPLANKAQRDWDWYQAHQTSSLNRF
jgi:hypothetical protein